MRRECCRANSGRLLSSCHWLDRLVQRARAVGCTQLFTKTATEFVCALRDCVGAIGLPLWRSAAFAAYLRDHHAEENADAVSQLVVDHSDSKYK